MDVIYPNSFPFLSEQRDELGCRFLQGEVELHLFVTLRMLLTPKLQEKWRHGGKGRLGSMNLGMAARAQGHHQVEH